MFENKGIKMADTKDNIEAQLLAMSKNASKNPLLEKAFQYVTDFNRATAQGYHRLFEEIETQQETQEMTMTPEQLKRKHLKDWNAILNMQEKWKSCLLLIIQIRVKFLIN